MKPAPFHYHDPTTVEAALDLLRTHEGAVPMAGNQSLGILMANRMATPDHVVDLGRIEGLDAVERDGDVVRIGATATHRAISRSSLLAEHLPILPDAARQIAGPSVRNRGTLGGSLAEADPAANYPTVLAALDGRVHLRSTDGERAVDARDFFVAHMVTERREDELVTGASVDVGPFPRDRTGMAFEELKPTSQTWPTVSAAAAVRVDDPDDGDPSIDDARLALANVADVPLRVAAAEDAVEGDPLDDGSLEAAADAVRAAADPTDELHADATFKREVAGEYARRALLVAYRRAMDG